MLPSSSPVKDLGLSIEFERIDIKMIENEQDARRQPKARVQIPPGALF